MSLRPSNGRLMTWHFQVLGMPQGLISGSVPSRLVESALLSQRQEPEKISLFDLLLGNILTTGKLGARGVGKMEESG